MSSISKEYSNGELVITWQPAKCIHSGKCVMGLPQVFKPKSTPWIEIENASTEELVNQVKSAHPERWAIIFRTKNQPEDS